MDIQLVLQYYPEIAMLKDSPEQWFSVLAVPKMGFFGLLLFDTQSEMSRKSLLIYTLQISVPKKSNTESQKIL